MSILSPCTGVCRVDVPTGWCIGCGRSGADMDRWGSRSEASRQAVWEVLPKRLEHLGVACRRLPWTADDIRRFVLKTLQYERGTWAIGAPEALATFAPGTETRVMQQDQNVIATARESAIRLGIDDTTVAFAFGQPGARDPSQIVLASARGRKGSPVSETIKDLGQDTGALMGRGGRLFDLGLGGKEGRFCLRAFEGAALDVLAAAQARPFSCASPRLEEILIAESPTRVMETALGRIELQEAVRPSCLQSRAVPHALLRPARRATRTVADTLPKLPRAYVPGAINLAQK